MTLDPELVEEPWVVIPDIVSLNGFDFGPDGLLYAPRAYAAAGGEIGRIDVDAEVVPEVSAELRAPVAAAPLEIEARVVATKSKSED